MPGSSPRAAADAAADLKVVVYRDHSYPRSFALSTRRIQNWLRWFGVSVAILALVFSLSARWLWHHRPVGHVPEDTRDESASTPLGPSQSQDELIRHLKDEIDKHQSRIKTLITDREQLKDIETQSPVLALFSPSITDQTKGQDSILVKNFSFASGRGSEPTTLTFELHNKFPNQSVQKGYIVVLARTSLGILAYPNVFNTRGKTLLDFEKGESFQVARFRMVNAQFQNFAEKLHSFQVLIFKRTGELLLNLNVDVDQK